MTVKELKAKLRTFPEDMFLYTDCFRFPAIIEKTLFLYECWYYEKVYSYFENPTYKEVNVVVLTAYPENNNKDKNDVTIGEVLEKLSKINENLIVIYQEEDFPDFFVADDYEYMWYNRKKHELSPAIYVTPDDMEEYKTGFIQGCEAVKVLRITLFKNYEDY